MSVFTDYGLLTLGDLPKRLKMNSQYCCDVVLEEARRAVMAISWSSVGLVSRMAHQHISKVAGILPHELASVSRVAWGRPSDAVASSLRFHFLVESPISSAKGAIVACVRRLGVVETATWSVPF
jgi:hypothetical protein